MYRENVKNSKVKSVPTIPPLPYWFGASSLPLLQNDFLLNKYWGFSPQVKVAIP
jgi:hypothetical protein